MNRFALMVVAASCPTLSMAAAPVLLPQPVQIGDETGRYRKGVPISVLERSHGAITVVPLPMDHGSYAFQIVVYNDGDTAANFDVTNIKAYIGGQELVPFTAEELASAAKNRAMWSQIGVAMLAGVAAAAAANSYTTNYHGQVYTPHGSYSWVSSYRDNSLGQVAAAGAVAGGALSIASIQGRLDATLDMIGEEVVQRTTVDPSSSYGGRFVLRKPKGSGDQRDIKLTVDWNGEQYAFAYHMPKRGEPLPAALKSSSGPDRMAHAAATPSPPAMQPAIQTAPATPPIPTIQPVSAIQPGKTI